MKVNNDSVKTNLRANAAAGAKKPSGAAKALTSPLGGEVATDKLGSTKVDFSERAQDIKKAKDIATNSPDINEAKVARLQALVDSGKYKTNSAAIADKLVDEQVRNAFFEEE